MLAPPNCHAHCDLHQLGCWPDYEAQLATPPTACVGLLRRHGSTRGVSAAHRACCPHSPPAADRVLLSLLGRLPDAEETVPAIDAATGRGMGIVAKRVAIGGVTYLKACGYSRHLGLAGWTGRGCGRGAG